ncbi:toll/interleukin-1 receptor domain-containing protein [Leclercia adecarboxylata]|uniref:toll/interleukin-1 receptor domain-containing protein n=1 Tax=Leclercia adecarboxylata TaxID=83655 RepID=UPI000907ABFC|nr:toll/interleukin-1 receptor domain-containing protein [Leclercia adecarboxylata]
MDNKSDISIFISYAWGGSLERKEWVRQQIVNSISVKYSVFWDRDTIGFGDCIDSCIRKALTYRPLKILCICDADYIQSVNKLGSGLNRELQFIANIAHEDQVKIIPLIFESDCIRELPNPLAGRVYLDLTELHKRNLFIGNEIFSLAEGITQAEMNLCIKKRIASNDLVKLARHYFQKMDIEVYGNARTHEITLSTLQPLLAPQWMWESKEWGYMLSDENATYCPAKGRWHWDYSTSSRGMRALGTVVMSVFFPGQTTPKDQQAFHCAGNIMAQRFFAMIYKHEPFILNSEDILGILINNEKGYRALKYLINQQNIKNS